jgi:PAS domain S-box-containing protein
MTAEKQGAHESTDITDSKREKSALRYSEENYRLVVETAPDAVISIDESSAILSANPATVRIFGYDPAELIGKPLTVLMPEFLRKLHEKGFSRYLATGQRHINWQGTELTALRKNGEEFPVEISFGELSRDGHKIFAGFIRDISERKQAEQMRAAHARQIAFRADVSIAFGKEESLRTILGECSEAIVCHLDAAFARIWTLSDDGKMLELQASAGMYTHIDGPHSHIPMGQFKIGMIAQERKPHLTNDLLHDPRISDRAWVEKVGMASFAGYPLTIGNRTIGVLAMFSRKPLMPEIAETLASGADLIAQGIERKRAQQTLQTTQTELARVSRLTTMGELAASIAHEVNQPLTAVTNNSSACLRLLAASNLKPEVLRRALEEIVADGTRASAVIARIRAFIKKAPAEKTELDMNEVIQEVLVLSGRELLENRILVECQLTKSLPPVLADRVQLQQVLLNLIMNGIEAMIAVTDKPRSLWVESQIDQSGDILIAVHDSGTGLGSEVDRVFTPFFTTKANGMGMGLSISRSIVENHGGRLWATPNVPTGAVFFFTLPVSAGAQRD